MPDKGIAAKDVLARIQKTYGTSVGDLGAKLSDSARIPFGVFQLDLASGGGMPRNRATTIFGPESSGKSNCVLRAIAVQQALHPELTHAMVDLEGLDPAWAKALGVDMEKLAWIRPAYAEQVVDIVESLLYAEDCGIVAVDSLAAMLTTQEADSSAEKANVGGASNPIGKMVRKTTLALAEAEKAHRSATLIYVNQTRYKIGVMFGDPETTPGGNAPRFQSSLSVRLYGKNKTDPKISKAMPVLKETTFILRKWKVPIVCPTGKFDMVMIPHDGFACGEVDDWVTISTFLKQLGQLEKQPKGRQIVGESYPTLEAFRTRMKEDKPFGAEVRGALITRVLADGMIGDAAE